MTSEPDPTRAYVWVWLPQAADPVVAGALDVSGAIVTFTYGQSYLRRPDAVPLYLPELPLQRWRQRPLEGLSVAGCIRDAAPDSWGQRVILHRRFGGGTRDTDTTELNLLAYLLESGSDRIGALDFQARPDRYVPRSTGGTLEEMVQAADRLQAGEPFSEDLDAVLLRGSSVGGARPKVLLDDNSRKLIAKFSAPTDSYAVVKAEAAAMELGRRVGLDVAPTTLTTCLGHDVLLVERFDRAANSPQRRMVVSALTILGLDEMAGRYATYYDLADVIRERFTSPKVTAHELFARVVFNILVGNTDDHARNHAALWNGEQLTLAPAYDICPQPRSGGEAAQAMAIGRGVRRSLLAGCVANAPTYLLTPDAAREIIDHQLDVIHTQWQEAADIAKLTVAQRQAFWGRQIINPFVLEGYPGP